MAKLATEPVMVRPEIKAELRELAKEIQAEQGRSRVSLGDVISLAVWSLRAERATAERRAAR